MLSLPSGLRVPIGAELKRRAVAKVREQVFQEKAFVASKVGLAVSLGTLLSLTPGYAAMWNNPVSLADQVIFTILGGANLTVGGMTTQLFYRLVLGSCAGACTYMALFSLGHWPIAQGVCFFLVVLLLTYVRYKSPKTDTGLQFATLAAVYAVDYSYRAGNPRGMGMGNGMGSASGAGWNGLADLLRSWAFGGAISVAVNVLVLPVKASRLARDRTVGTLGCMSEIITWLLPHSGTPLIASSSHTPGGGGKWTPIAVRQTLASRMSTLHQLHAELSWEVGYTASDLGHREALLSAVDEVQRCLVRGSRGGSFADLEPELRDLLDPSLGEFASWLACTLSSAIELLEGKKPASEPWRGSGNAEKGDHAPPVYTGAWIGAELAQVKGTLTDMVVAALKARASLERIEQLDRATHCLHTIERLAEAIGTVHSLALAQSQRKKRVQAYIVTTLSSTISTFARPTGLAITDGDKGETGSRRPSKATSGTYIPPPSLISRIMPHLTSPAAQYALKVPLALSCLLALLWAPATRPFFLSYAVRNSTVPLLLALMPTLGLSVLSWIGQLSGAVVGALYAAMAMRIFRGVGPRAYSAPGLFFFEWILCLAVGHRMREGPDFFAVTAMNAYAIFINVQWHLTGTPGEATLPLRLGFMLTTASIAIALAIPFQLLIFPQHARAQIRAGVARILRRMARLAVDEVELSSAVLYTSDRQAIAMESERLRADVDGIKADLMEQDGLHFLAAHEWGQSGTFQLERGSALLDSLYCCVDSMADHIALASVGPVHPNVREALVSGNRAAAMRYAQASSLTFWSLGAAWELSEAPPCTLPSVHDAARDLLYYLDDPSLSSMPSAHDPSRSGEPVGARASSDVRESELVSRDGVGGSDHGHAHQHAALQRDMARLWSLTLTLVTQRAPIELLIRILGPDWTPASAITGEHVSGSDDDTAARERGAARPCTTREFSTGSMGKRKDVPEGEGVLPVVRRDE